MMRRVLAVAALAMIATPAMAKVDQSDERGFSISYDMAVNAPPMVVYDRITHPAMWWSSEHSWSGNARNMTLDPRAGGCWCERWGANSAEHGRVVGAQPGKLLRISAPLGPMQGLAVAATLTFELTPKDRGTHINIHYIAGGSFGADARQIAPMVDKVLGEQVERLRASLAGK